MSYDPNIDHSAQRIIDSMKNELSKIAHQIADLESKRTTLQSTISAAETIMRDEARRLENLK